MAIIMDMETGMRESEINACDAGSLGYDDEVLHAGWTEVPRLEPRLEEATVIRAEPSEQEIEAFLARLYLAQG